MNRLLAFRQTVDRATFNDADRRWMGALLGAGLALVYAVISQTINVIALPGIPVYAPPFGTVLNIVALILLGLALGLLSAWPQSSAYGIILASAAATLVFVLVVLLDGSNAYQGPTKILVPIVISLPVAGILAVPIGLFRWLLNKQEEARHDAIPLRVRARVPFVLLIGAGVLAASWMYPPEGRELMLQMQTLLQSGLQTSNASALPEAFQHQDVKGFIEHATPRYTLQWDKNDLTRFAIPRPANVPEHQLSAVIARFDNGWSFACLYTAVDAKPRCKSY